MTTTFEAHCIHVVDLKCSNKNAFNFELTSFILQYTFLSEYKFENQA